MGWHVVFPRSPYPGTSHRMPTRSIPASPSMPESWQSHDAGFCRLHVESNNKPYSVAFSNTFDCSQTVGAFEVQDDRLRRKVRDKPVDQLLFGLLENGRISRQRTGHDEARSGPRRVAVGSVSTVCSQRCHRLVGLNSGPVTNRDRSFHTRTSRNVTEKSEISCTLIL